jgi:hypothetical protein
MVVPDACRLPTFLVSYLKRIFLNLADMTLYFGSGAEPHSHPRFRADATSLYFSFSRGSLQGSMSLRF